MSLIGFLLNLSSDTEFAEQAMSESLKELGEFGDWSCGHVFAASVDSNSELLSKRFWLNPKEDGDFDALVSATKGSRVIWGADVPGRVLASGGAEWFSRVEQFPQCSRMELASKLGFRSAFAFPVSVAGEIVAVLEFFGKKEKPPDAEQIELGRLVGRYIGWTMERDRRSAELIRARQEALDASVAKSNFLAQVSHEIRTPLNAVLGMTHLMLSTRLNEDQRDYAESIKTSAHSLLRIVNDILDISRIEAGKFEIQAGDFHVETLLKDTLAMLMHLARGKGLELTYHLESGLSDILKGDAGRLRQVLLNLAGNAIKFTDRGSVAIRVISEERSAGSVQVRFEVEDSGIGIPENLHAKLFDVFTQADSSAARKYGGTGLGLSISKRLVELMGGEIGFHSREGAGSIFWFTIPLDEITRSQPISTESPTVSHIGFPLMRNRKHAALIVEDNPMNQRVMMKMLEAMGLTVRSANSGPEAIVAVREQEFDLIFMDCQMPEMDGYEATREIRRWESENGREPVPIIAVTANVIQGDRERCLAVGMNDYLAKPIDPDRLVTRIKFWLKQLENSEELDRGILERIRKMNVEGEADFLLELIGLFHESSPERIERIKEALEKRDGTWLSREAHYLKSSSANLGAMRLSMICQRLDEMGRARSFDRADEMLEMLRYAYDRARMALAKEARAQTELLSP